MREISRPVHYRAPSIPFPIDLVTSILAWISRSFLSSSPPSFILLPFQPPPTSFAIVYLFFLFFFQPIAPILSFPPQTFVIYSIFFEKFVGKLMKL